MASNVPKTVTIKKGEVIYESNLDRTQYTITELSRAALKDVAKLLRQRIKSDDNMPFLTGNLKKNVGTWVKLQDGRPMLQVGVYDSARAHKKGLKHAFYAPYLELGTSEKQPVNEGRGFLKHVVQGSITDIRKIEAQYLKEIEDEIKAIGLIEDGEEIADD